MLMSQKFKSICLSTCVAFSGMQISAVHAERTRPLLIPLLGVTSLQQDPMQGIGHTVAVFGEVEIGDDGYFKIHDDKDNSQSIDFTYDVLPEREVSRLREQCIKFICREVVFGNMVAGRLEANDIRKFDYSFGIIYDFQMSGAAVN